LFQGRSPLAQSQRSWEWEQPESPQWVDNGRSKIARIVVANVNPSASAVLAKLGLLRPAEQKSALCTSE